MGDLLFSLILLDITKRDFKVTLSLCLLYLSYLKEKKDKRVIKIRDISAMTSLTSTVVAASLDNLIDYNIVGRLTLDTTVEGRKVKDNFQENFLYTLKNKDKKRAIVEAIDRVGYYVTDDTQYYVFNPITDTWKYPGWKRVNKALTYIDGLMESNLIKELIKNKNTGKNKDNQKVNGISIKRSLYCFAEKFEEAYGSIYALNWAVEYPLMKALLKQFVANNIQEMAKIESFFIWSFKKGKEKDYIVHINSLKYYANEFLTKNRKSKNYYYDDKGVLHKKTG